MSRTPIQSALAHAALFIDTVDHHAGLRDALQNAGYTQALHRQGEEAIEKAQEALDHITHHVQTDKLAGHLVHTAATEVEMWHQTARFRVRKALGADHPQVDDLMGADVHGPNHTTAVLAQAERFTSLVRLDDALRAQLDDKMSVEDLLQRGNALRVKLVRLAEDNAHPHDTDADSHIAPAAAALNAFLEQATSQAKSALRDQPSLLGMLGITPADQASPLGGTASSVTRHERTFREAPQQRPAPPAPGWSAGRQGRNNKNVGKGY